MKSLDISSNQKLVEQAKKGSPKAFAQLYETIYKDLYRFAMYTLSKPHDAEDAVSETILLAYDKISTLRNAAAFKSWMFQILSNQCRKKWKEQEKQQPEKDMNQFEPVDMEDLGDDLSMREALLFLASEDRLIVTLSVFGGWNSKEIGDQLDLNAATVRSKLRRALGKLKLFLEEPKEAENDR